MRTIPATALTDDFGVLMTDAADDSLVVLNQSPLIADVAHLLIMLAQAAFTCLTYLESPDFEEHGTHYGLDASKRFHPFTCLLPNNSSSLWICTS
jgi:hypothetical protein